MDTEDVFLEEESSPLPSAIAASFFFVALLTALVDAIRKKRWQQPLETGSTPSQNRDEGGEVSLRVPGKENRCSICDHENNRAGTGDRCAACGYTPTRSYSAVIEQRIDLLGDMNDAIYWVVKAVREMRGEDTYWDHESEMVEALSLVFGSTPGSVSLLDVLKALDEDHLAKQLHEVLQKPSKLKSKPFLGLLQHAWDAVSKDIQQRLKKEGL